MEKKTKVETGISLLGTAITTTGGAVGTAVGTEFGHLFMGKMAGTLVGQAVADRAEAVAQDWVEAYAQFADDVRSLYQAVIDTADFITGTVDLVMERPDLAVALIKRQINMRRGLGPSGS